LTSGDGVPAQELDTATTIGNLREANEVLEADQVRSQELNSKQIAFLGSLQSAVRRSFEQQLKTA